MSIGDQFEKLVAIMEKLRSPEGCPWDRQQTHASLRPYLLEETYEVLECIDEHRFSDLKLELGDLLLQVIFHAHMTAEAKQFTIAEVIDAICEKMVRRHPHVFGDARVATAQEQTHLWERIKKNEGKPSALDGVPTALPALQRATRLQQKAMAAGFRWHDEQELWRKLQEQLDEFAEAHANDNHFRPGGSEDELGDILFVMAQIAYYANVNPEDALRGACEKFIRRFQKMETQLLEHGRHLHDTTIEEMEKAWQAAKNAE